MYDLLEEVEDAHGSRTCPVSSRGIGGVEGESSHSQFHDGQASTPDVRSYRVCASLDTFWSHVSGSTDECICYGIDCFGSNAKVTQLDAAS